MMKLIITLAALLSSGVADVTTPRLRAAHTVLLAHQAETETVPAQALSIKPVANATAPPPVTAIAAAESASDTDKDQDDDADDADDADMEEEAAKAPAAANATRPVPAEDVRKEEVQEEQKFDIEKIEQSLAKLKGGSAKATPGMIKFVTMTKDMIKNDMKPKIMDAHKKDQELLDSYKNGFGKCSKGRSTAAAAMITLAKTKVGSSSLHKRCRKDEAAKFKTREECEDLLDAKKETQKAACDALKDLNRNPNTEANNCHAANKERYEEWLDRNEQWFINKNKEYKMHKGKCDAAKAEVDKLTPVCASKAKDHVGQKAQCDINQDKLEEASCNEGKKMAQTCYAYVGCYDSTKKTYRKNRPIVEKQESDRKVEWRVLLRVGCLLDVFAEDDGEVDEQVIGQCKNKTHDTSHLDLAYPSIPEKEKCKPLPAVPGSTEFKQAEYSALPENADAKMSSLCVVEAGGGVELGAPQGVPAAKCSMSGGGYLKASQSGSCMLSDTDGDPIEVDYTKNTFTTYSFVMKFDGNPGNYNRMPVGGFKVCNTDRKSYSRGRSPEFNFYDIRGMWGYTYVRHPHTWRKYQNRRSSVYQKAYPKNGQEVRWDITMQYRSNKRLYIYSWNVNGVPLTGYRNYITNCWNHGRHHAFTPRIWAYGGTKGVYIKDFRVYQGLHPMDMVQIVGTGIPKTPYTVQCAEKGIRYSGRGINGYGAYRTKNVLNCQKRCAYLSGCEKFTYSSDGICHYFQAGARKHKASQKFLSGPPTCDSPYKTGLKADFFFYKYRLHRLPNLLHAKPDFTRTDLTVWYAQTGHHWPGIKQRDLFAARWTGSLLIKKGGNYRFDLTSDDGSFLFIDGKVVVSNPGLHGPRTIYRWVRLNAGWHDIMMTMFENYGGANMYFRYYGPDTMYHHWAVPTEVLRPADKKDDKKPNGPFGTPDNQRYYKFPDQSKLQKKGDVTYLLATVRAKNDAHIGLFPEEIKDPVNQGGAFYEFVLGGWGDQRSAIRRSRRDHPKTFPYTRNIVSKYEYRNFWVAFNKKTGVASAGKGHTLGKYKVMEWKDSRPLSDIKSFGVMTGWSGTGEWYFVNKKAQDPTKKPTRWAEEGWFLGNEGDDCTKTCADQGRTCDDDIKSTFSYNKFRMYVKEEMGVTCEKDTRRWWAHDQPCYVSGGRDSNQNKCLAYSNIPTKVRCSGRHSKVMRWCKCSATSIVAHMVNLGKYTSWADMKKAAEAKGGRLMTLAEARLFLVRRGGVIFRGRDVWAPVEDKGGKKDWVQLGSRWHRSGTSHVEKYRYPSWGDNIGLMPRYRHTTFTYLIYATTRR